MTARELLLYALAYATVAALTVGGIELGSWLMSPDGHKALVGELP